MCNTIYYQMFRKLASAGSKPKAQRFCLSPLAGPVFDQAAAFYLEAMEVYTLVLPRSNRAV